MPISRAMRQTVDGATAHFAAIEAWLKPVWLSKLSTLERVWDESVRYDIEADES
jgi:hypothetical protein